jgi:outer membrane protein assembly factor BamB
MFLLVVLTNATGQVAVSSEPTLKWSYGAQSTLYAPPLAADVCPAPGSEVIVSDSEARRLLCVDARGSLVWECKAGWTKRLTTAAALSFTARPGRPTLILGASDGRLTCIDAATGVVLWQQTAGPIEWGSVVWADLDADGQDEAVAGTEHSGVVAYCADGVKTWEYRGEKGAPSVRIPGPIAAADVDGDGKAEVFAAGAWGPFCLNSGGTLRWQRLTGDEFVCGVTVADADRDGAPELYAASRNDNALFCLDARTGAVRWKTPTVGEADAYAGASIAMGDVDGDGREEIAAADALGNVYCLSPSGEVLWVFETQKRTHAAVSLGDVDGDEAVEVLAASGDHHLYCIDGEGQLKWRYAATLRLIYPATIADVDDDGKTDILCCGSDKTLRCLTLGGRYRPDLVPWASRRCDAAQSGARFGKPLAAPSNVAESAPLLEYGGFETGKVTAPAEMYPADGTLLAARKSQPYGWSAGLDEDAVFMRDTAAAFVGGASLKTAAGGAPFTFRSDPIPVKRGLESVRAAVMAKGGSPEACLEWEGLQGLARRDSLAPAGAENGWTRLAAEDIVPPRQARWVRLACRTAPGTTTWWDAAEIVGRCVRPRQLRVLVNQAGYDAGAPKRFTVQSNFLAEQASFEVIGQGGAASFSAALHHEGRIQGAYGHDWGFEYWRGDFSAFDAPGAYCIRVTLDSATDVSWPFEVGPELLWQKTAVPAYRFFYYQRCGTAVPGFHGACHLDDAVSPDGKTQYELWGGWHDAGDYNTYHNAPYVLGLCQAYALRKEAFDRCDDDGNGIADLFDEILWGGAHSRRMIAPDGSAYGPITSGYGFWGPPELETDNVPGTGDERRISGAELGNDSGVHLAAMAKIARCAEDKKPWIEAAERALAWAVERNAHGPAQFSAVLDLYDATGDKKYAVLAKEWLPEPSIETVHAVQQYDQLFGEDHRAELRENLVARAEETLELARNPFGVCTHGPKERPNFFGTPADATGWHVGNSSHVLNAANTLALAYQFNPDPRYLVFVYDQFNWILGNNPYDISLMEGVGSAFPPTYHNRITFAGVPRGAIPGSVVNGITWRGPGDDRPYFDMRGLDIPAFEPNEVWLPHNTAYLNALVNLSNARNR